MYIFCCKYSRPEYSSMTCSKRAIKFLSNEFTVLLALNPIFLESVWSGILSQCWRAQLCMISVLFSPMTSSLHAKLFVKWDRSIFSINFVVFESVLMRARSHLDLTHDFWKSMMVSNLCSLLLLVPLTIKIESNISKCW